MSLSQGRLKLFHVQQSRALTRTQRVLAVERAGTDSDSGGSIRLLDAKGVIRHEIDARNVISLEKLSSSSSTTVRLKFKETSDAVSEKVLHFSTDSERQELFLLLGEMNGAIKLSAVNAKDVQRASKKLSTGRRSISTSDSSNTDSRASRAAAMLARPKLAHYIMYENRYGQREARHLSISNDKKLLILTDTNEVVRAEIRLSSLQSLCVHSIETTALLLIYRQGDGKTVDTHETCLYFTSNTHRKEFLDQMQQLRSCEAGKWNVLTQWMEALPRERYYRFDGHKVC